jgi:hypothetical protein
MSKKIFTIALGLTTALFGVSCDKNQSNSGSSQTTTATPTPGTVAPGATAAAADTLAGTYNALSTVENSTNRRHQQLTLNADMTAQLNTEITATGSPTPTSQHAATGNYVAKGDEVTVTLSTEDGKPIPASNTTHVMHLTAQKSFKSLLGDDGRTFERAK